MVFVLPILAAPRPFLPLLPRSTFYHVTMRSWSDKLRSATQTLLAVVTDLHTKTNDSVMLRLVTSVTDIVHLVDQLNSAHRFLEKELERERKSSEKLVIRVEQLEQRYAESQTVKAKIQNQQAQQESDVASVRSGGPAREATPPDNSSYQQQLAQQSQQLEQEEKPKGTPFKSPPRTPSPSSSPPKQQSISPYKPPSPKQLPPLPTLQDVEAEQRQRRSQKRALASQKPPPCEKCLVRKRAMMLREHGYVKEDVYMRWAKRPGGCIAFMHYDEPLPEGGESELSFKDTETESPDT